MSDKATPAANEIIDQNEGQKEERPQLGALIPAGPSTALLEVLQPRENESNLVYMVRLMEMLPPATEDVIDSIAGRILAADSFEAENALWDSTGSKDAVGESFIFHSVHIQPSDYEEGVLPFFLVCKVTHCGTGERTVLTTGSTNICTSLVKAQLLRRLPAQAQIVGPRRTPKSGHVPLRLRWQARMATGG